MVTFLTRFNILTFNICSQLLGIKVHQRCARKRGEVWKHKSGGRHYHPHIMGMSG